MNSIIHRYTIYIHQFIMQYLIIKHPWTSLIIRWISFDQVFLVLFWVLSISVSSKLPVSFGFIMNTYQHINLSFSLMFAVFYILSYCSVQFVRNFSYIEFLFAWGIASVTLFIICSFRSHLNVFIHVWSCLIIIWFVDLVLHLQECFLFYLIRRTLDHKHNQINFVAIQLVKINILETQKCPLISFCLYAV